MCTYSWCPAEAGFELWVNRDEQKTRPQAETPAIRELDGIQFLAPRDPQGGGTWLFVNELGVAATLLNLYRNDARPGTPEVFGGLRSRGLLMWDLAKSKDATAIRDGLITTDLKPYSPFTIAVPRPSLQASDLHQWDGMRLTHALLPFGAPFVSSSFAPKDVATQRNDTFGHLTGDAPPTTATCHAFHHADGSGDPSPYSVLMDRKDAQTWSIARAKVWPEGIAIDYEELAPDLAGPSLMHSVTLPR